jgi:N-methylhydantoinase A/oxoprolinase/acetone carboxylase beta subunit
MKFPVFTFSCGPTNSFRGASFLTDNKDCIVVDIGGTSTDVGFLMNGFPRPASAYTTIGGIRINFRMPDTVSIGLGGGSIV